MNMGMAEAEMQEKLERLHQDSIHDDGCYTQYPGGTCDCTQSGKRDGSPYPEIGLFDIRGQSGSSTKIKPKGIKRLTNLFGLGDGS